MSSLTEAAESPQNGKVRKHRRLADAMRDTNSEIRIQAVRELERLISHAREGINGHVTVTVLVVGGTLKKVRTEIVNHLDKH